MRGKPPAKTRHAAPTKVAREIRSTVYPTGNTRWLDGRYEAEYTDGQQTWWAKATEAG